jgi:hypothetical protein
MTLKTKHILFGLAFVIALPAGTNAVADAFENDDRTTATSASLPTLSAAKFNQPVCYAYNTQDYDGVISLYKENDGQIYGKGFGVKKVKNKSMLLPFEQELEGRYISNHKVKMDVVTQFEDRLVKRSDVLNVKSDTLQFEENNMTLGSCKRLVNDFLSRDIERRRAYEEAQKNVL